MISLRSGSCLSKLERVKENIFEVFQIKTKIKLLNDILKSHGMFSFTRFCLRVLADLNEIIRRMKRNVILTIAIESSEI